MGHLVAPQIPSRVAAGVLGSWAFVFGLVGLGTMLLQRLGMSYEDAHTLMYLLGPLVMLAAFIAAFAAASLARVWAALVGGGMLMSGAAWLMTRAGT